MAGKGHPSLATPHCSLAPESRRLPMPDKTYNAPPHPCTIGLTSISQETRVFLLEPPHGLHTHSCVLKSQLGSQRPKADTAERKPAGAEYPQIGDSSSKFAFPYAFRSLIGPKPEFTRNTNLCGIKGSSTPSNSPLLNSSRKSTFTHARQNLQLNPSPMHNGFDLDFPRNHLYYETKVKQFFQSKFFS